MSKPRSRWSHAPSSLTAPELAAKLSIPVNWLYVQIRQKRLLLDRQPSGAYLFQDAPAVLDSIRNLRNHCGASVADSLIPGVHVARAPRRARRGLRWTPETEQIVSPSSRIRRPKPVFLATGARYQFDIPRRYFAATAENRCSEEAGQSLEWRG